MAIILGTVLFLGVVAFTLPILYTYCNQTSETPEEIPEEKNDEEEEEIIDKECSIQQESTIRKISKLRGKTERGLNDEKWIIEKEESKKEERIRMMETCHLAREFSKIEEKEITDSEETIKEYDDDDDDEEEEEEEKTLKIESTPLSNRIILNDNSPNEIQQQMTVQADVHANNPQMIIVQKSLDNTNIQTPVNNTKKKSKFFKFKKLLTRSERRKKRPRIEESGSSSSFSQKISEIHLSPTNIETNQRPLANSTINNSQFGTVNLQIHNPNGTLSIYAQSPNGRDNNSIQDSGFRSFIETSTIYKDLPNGRQNNIVTLPLPDTNRGNITLVSLALSFANSGDSRNLNNEQYQTMN